MKVIIKSNVTETEEIYKNITDIKQGVDSFTGKAILELVNRQGWVHNAYTANCKVVVDLDDYSTKEEIMELKAKIIEARKYAGEIYHTSNKELKLANYLINNDIPSHHPAVDLLEWDILEDIREYTGNCTSKFREVPIISQSFTDRLDSLFRYLLDPCCNPADANTANYI